MTPSYRRTAPAAVLLAAPLLCAPPPVAATFDPWAQPARYELEYRADLGALSRNGSATVRVWLPAPAENTHQKLLSSSVEGPWPHRETRDRYGNRIIYFERNGGASPGGEVVMRFVVERSPADGIATANAQAGTPLDPQRYLGSHRRIPLDGLIGQIAEQESRGRSTAGEKIRAFYEYVVRSMRYAKDGEGWGQGDAIWACTAKYGNCTDFHSLFIGLARSQNIPARFVIGFPLPATASEGTVAGYHCWAEAFDPRRGWLPVDASEAKKSGRIDDYFGAIPSDRVEFSVGRDLVLEPPQRSEPVNYFIYPYAEVDGTPVPKVPATVRFRRLPETAQRR